MTAPLVGWRAWSLRDNQLVGATGWPWKSRIRRAWCATWHDPSGADLPFDHCVCGVYAYTDLSLVLAQAASIWGQVSLWGQVAIHEIGYRAEWARIDRLWTRTASQKKTLLRIFPTLCEDPDGGLVFLDDDLDAEIQILTAQAEWEGQGLEMFDDAVHISSPFPLTPRGIFSGRQITSTLLCRIQAPLNEGRAEVAVPRYGGTLIGFGVACPCDGYVEFVRNNGDIPIAFHSQHRKWVSLSIETRHAFTPGVNAPASIRFTLPRGVRVSVGTLFTVYFAIQLPYPRRLW